MIAGEPEGVFMQRNTRWCVLGVTLALLLGDMTPSAQDREFEPVTDAMLQDPSPDDWLMWRRTLDSWGYSPLDQITRGNVDDLQMVWSNGLYPQLSSVRRHINQSSGEGSCSIASVTGSNSRS
jgi:glucose dehydrogenase